MHIKPTHIKFTFKTKLVHFKFKRIIYKTNILYAKSTLQIKIT